MIQFDNVGYVVVKDWDAKVSDSFSLSNEPAQGYGFGYPKENASENGDDYSAITDVSTLKGVLDARQNDQYTPVRHTGIGDTYSVPPSFINLGDHDYIQVCEILNDADEDYDTEVDGEKFDNHMSVNLIRNIPLFFEREEWDEDDSYPEGGTWILTDNGYRMAGLVSFPADGGERDAKVIIGVFESNQLIGKGKKMTDSGADANAAYNLSAASLYQRHQGFEEWLAKNRQVVSVDLELSIQDIINFRMWHAVIVRSRMFIVKRLTLHLSMKRDAILSSADLISL